MQEEKLRYIGICSICLHKSDHLVVDHKQVYY